MTDRPLRRSSPSAEGVDAGGIEAFLDVVGTTPQIELHGLMVLRHGRVVASGWWAPYTPERVHLLYSVSKSFTSTAAGIAVGEGLLRLDDPVLSYFPELDGEVTDPGSRSILVRHVAAMASGHDGETLERAAAIDRGNLVRGFLLLPPERRPGSVFAYNQPATYSLAAIVQRVTGQSLTGYLRPRLLDPLGIGDAFWEQDPPGTDVGFSGLHATTEAVAKLGQLYLQHGLWEGRQLVPKEWVAEATRAQIPTLRESNPDWARGYGYQFWVSRHGFRADGAYGQFALVLPEQDLVVAITSATTDTQRLLTAVWEHLVPACADGSEPEADADAALVERLAGGALPRQQRQPRPADPAEWDGLSFAPAGGSCAAQRSLARVDVAADKQGWSVTLTDAGVALTAALGTDGWAVSERSPLDGTRAGAGTGPVPVATTGGWDEQGRLAYDVVFLETPHRLVVTCSLPEATFEARWVTAPLGGVPLRRLRAPR